MLGALQIPVSWTELFKRTFKEFSADDCLGLAAQLAYYLLLALVPAIVFLVALTSFFPPRLIEQMMTSVNTFAPPEMAEILRTQMQSIASGSHVGLLTFGFGMALWSSAAAIVAVTDALDRAYDIEEGRPWWKVRLIAIALTVALAAFLIVSFALVVAGPTLAEWVAAHVGFGPVFEWSWKILQWPVVFALVSVALALLNYFGPDADQDWTWVTPGAVVATGLWLIASLAFKFYVGNFANYNETYGSLGGIIVLMLWFYISGVAILVGAEMNAEIEHASPHGKNPGERYRVRRRSSGREPRARWLKAAARAKRQAPLPCDTRHQHPRRSSGRAPATPSASSRFSSAGSRDDSDRESD
jgi:membrane protein